MKVSLIQMNSTDDKAKNLASAVQLIDEAVAVDCPELVVLPELFTYLGGTTEGAMAAAEVFPDGEAYRLIQDKARQHNVYIHAGSLVEKEGDNYYNTTVVFDEKGNSVASYRKIHLFDITTPDGLVFNESATYTAGSSTSTYDIKGNKAACSICYDVRFPELYIDLAKQGAKLIVIPAAFTLQTGKDHWEVLCRARAIESQCYVLAPNQYGQYIEDAIPRANYGNSMIIDPWGAVLARAADKVGHICAELDFAYLDTIRAKLPSLQHRKLC